MSDETQLILGDAVADATSEGRRGLFRRRRKRRKTEAPLTHCQNCGAELTGEYCAKCGQHAIDYKRSLWRVLIDAADSFFNWDTKFFSTLGILLTRPWKLTNDFNAGRRARYVHPLRLYLLASIAFFLIFKLVQLNPETIQLNPEDRAQIVAALGKLTSPDSTLPEDQRAKLEAARQRIAEARGAFDETQKKEIQRIVKEAMATGLKAKFDAKERANLRANLRALPEIPQPPSSPTESASPAPSTVENWPNESLAPSPPPAVPNESAAPAPPPIPSIPPHPHDGPNIMFGGHEANTPFESWLESRIKNKVGEGGTKAKLFAETLRNNIPTMMLCCIPLFALVLKMLYLGRRRYYIEHLVYALHVHSFTYLAVTATTLIGLGLARWSETARALVCTALGFIIFAQVFLSIRRVYGQGWFFSIFKFLLGGFVYFVILVCAVGVTAFVTLLLPD